MALGVVAPVAGVVNVNAAEQQGDNNLTTNSQKAADAKVKEVKRSLTDIQTHDADGDVLATYKAADAYAFINNIAADLMTAEDFIKNSEDKGGAITAAFQAAVTNYTWDGGTIKPAIDNAKNIKDSDGKLISTYFTDTNKWGNTVDLATSRATTNAMIAVIEAAVLNATGTDKTDLQMIAHNLREVVKDSYILDLSDAAVLNAENNNQFTTIKALYAQLTGKAAPAINSVAKLNEVLTADKNGIGTANWSKFRRIYKLINRITAGLTNRDASDVQLDEWVAQLTTAAGNSGSATVEPTEKPTTDPTIDAPQSGVLGSAEGSATTISIVAGLATALTALGAGVVAYRNARREK